MIVFVYVNVAMIRVPQDKILNSYVPRCSLFIFLRWLHRHVDGDVDSFASEKELNYSQWNGGECLLWRTKRLFEVFAANTMGKDASEGTNSVNAGLRFSFFE